MTKAIVIGAGVAGLSAARTLVRAGWEVEVFEALPRVGGRVHTLRAGSGVPPLELGADFLHGRHPKLMQLLKRAKASIRSAEGPHLTVKGGRTLRVGSAFERAMALLDRMADTSARNVTRFLDPHWSLDPEAADAAKSFVEGFYAAQASRASAQAIGRMQRVASEIGGDSVYRVWQGYDAGPLQLLRELEGKARVRLGMPVRLIRWRPGAVKVEATCGRATVCSEADVAVLALPLPMLKGFSDEAPRFVPELREKAEPLSKLWMGPVVKALLAFERPLWSEGRRGKPMGFFHLPSDEFPVWWRPLPHPEPALVGWAGGPHAKALGKKDSAGQIEAAVGALASGFGMSRAETKDALNLVRVVDWSREPFIRGGYAVVAPGGEEAMSELARPLRSTLFFAGEATEPDLAGTVHGALVSGERAAGEVVTARRS